MRRSLRHYPEKNDLSERGCRARLDGARTGVCTCASAEEELPKGNTFLLPNATENGNRQTGDVVALFEDSSTASAADSLRRIFDPTERQPRISPEGMFRSAPVNRQSLLTDISRCQTQVEELIALFKTDDAKRKLHLETSPRLRQRFKSRLPRQRAEGGTEVSAQLEMARQQLTQCLENALMLLNPFPREQERLQRSLRSPEIEDLSHQELMEAVDCLEQLSLETTSSEEERARSRPLLGRPPSNTDRLPMLEETLTISSDPCSTPSGQTGEKCWILNRAEETFERLSPSLPLFRSKSTESFVPFCAHYQDPISLGDLSRQSSQSLSGWIAERDLRVRMCLERDAVSDSEILARIEEMSPVCRRCYSSIAALCPLPAGHSSPHQRYLSIAASSDWDLVEGGCFLEGLTLLSPSPHSFPIDENLEAEMIPGRLTPETLAWTSNDFSTLELWTQDPSLEALPSAVMSKITEGSTRLSQEELCKVDRSVQCDLSVSDQFLPQNSRCGFWFKKKNRKQRKGLLERAHLPLPPRRGYPL